MDLPNYFLADLPTDLPLRGEMVSEACQTLRRNRERYLLPRSTDSVIQAVVEVARNWLTPGSPWKAMALERGPKETGFSREVLAAGLDDFFRRLTARNLTALVVQEFGHPQRLERLTSNDAETLVGTAAQVLGPAVLGHIAAGVLPTPVFTAIVHGLIVRSAQFVKCASGASFLPRLFAHSLRDVEPKLASCLEVAEWKGGGHPAESALFSEAEAVVASGADGTMEALRRVVPSRVRLLTHGHRVSAGYVARESLSPVHENGVIEAAAADVAAWDQLGCLSPQAIYVETGGVLPPEAFAARLAEELSRVEQRLPRGRVSDEASAAIFHRREFYRVRATADPLTTRCWFSPDSTAWSVVYEADPQFQLSCLHRFIYVKAVDTVEDCLRQAESVRGRWSTVGLAAIGPRLVELAQQFASWGITRVCPLGRMQSPPLTWRHDGRPVLGDLVQWAGHELPLDA